MLLFRVGLSGANRFGSRLPDEPERISVIAGYSTVSHAPRTRALISRPQQVRQFTRPIEDAWHWPKIFFSPATLSSWTTVWGFTRCMRISRESTLRKATL